MRCYNWFSYQLRLEHSNFQHGSPISLDMNSSDIGKRVAFLFVFFSWEDNYWRYFGSVLDLSYFLKY